MSDSKKSGVTYTDISSPFEELSDIKSPRADDHEHFMLLEMLEDPYVEPDYITGPEHADDDIVAKDQPYAKDASPIAQSPEYIPESDFEAHPEDDDDEDLEEDPVDYPADGGDDGDDEEESSEDDKDDEDEDMDAEADEEEEEHPAPADSVVVAPTVTDQAPSVEETKPFETDESAATPPPHPAYRTTARISIPAPSSPPPQIPFPPLPPILSPPSPVLSLIPPPSPIRSLGYRAAMIRLRDEAVSTSSPPLQLPSASRREDRLEVILPPRKRLDIALGPRYEVGESSSAVAARPAGGFRADYGFVATVDREIMHDPEREIGYRITDSWDEIMETLQGTPVSTDTELGGYVREFETRVRQDTDEIYMRLDDEQTERQLLAGRLNIEAWVLVTDTSDLVHGEVMSVRTTVLGQMLEIKELQAADRRRQTVISELLRIDHRRSIEISELRTALQGQVTTLQAQVTTLQGQQGLAGDHTQSELPEEAGGRVTAALAPHDALRSTNGDDSHNSGTGVRRTERVARECTYTDFLKCQPLPFKGTEGVSSLSQWKLEMKLWELKVKGTDLASYTQRFQELALLCGRMFFEEADKIEKYVGGLPNMIHGSVVASKPKTMQEAIEIATELVDKKIRTVAEREIASKRKFENTSRNTQNQQQQHLNKRQNISRVYTTASSEKKQYGGSRPLCAKCNYHHDGPCAPKCRNCNKFGHATRDCRNMTNTNNANNQTGTELGQKPTCYECGVQGHFRREYPKLKNNNNHGNQGGRNNASARVYDVSHAGTDPDANIVMDIVMSDSEDSTVTDTKFVSEPLYSEFMPLEEDVLPSKEQLLPTAVSPTSDSPGYILESDLEEDLQKDLEEDDEDRKEDPDDYPTDRYNDDNEEQESYSDEADDKDEDREEEEEHPSTVDSVPPPVYRVMVRMFVRAQTPMSLP
nr:hypothetical protein [Tanacetum cinerariifolium]